MQNKNSANMPNLPCSDINSTFKFYPTIAENRQGRSKKNPEHILCN